jgi:hypothetical protein
VSAVLVAEVVKQHSDHPSWSYKLHADNLVAATEFEVDAALGHVPSYTTVRRLMKERGLFRRKKRGHGGREGDDKSRAIFDSIADDPAMTRPVTYPVDLTVDPGWVTPLLSVVHTHAAVALCCEHVTSSLVRAHLALISSPDGAEPASTCHSALML